MDSVVAVEHRFAAGEIESDAAVDRSAAHDLQDGRIGDEFAGIADVDGDRIGSDAGHVFVDPNLAGIAEGVNREAQIRIVFEVQRIEVEKLAEIGGDNRPAALHGRRRIERGGGLAGKSDECSRVFHEDAGAGEIDAVERQLAGFDGGRAGISAVGVQGQGARALFGQAAGSVVGEIDAVGQRDDSGRAGHRAGSPAAEQLHVERGAIDIIGARIGDRDAGHDAAADGGDGRYIGSRAGSRRDLDQRRGDVAGTPGGHFERRHAFSGRRDERTIDAGRASRYVEIRPFGIHIERAGGTEPSIKGGIR